MGERGVVLGGVGAGAEVVVLTADLDRPGVVWGVAGAGVCRAGGVAGKGAEFSQAVQGARGRLGSGGDGDRAGGADRVCAVGCPGREGSRAAGAGVCGDCGGGGADSLSAGEEIARDVGVKRPLISGPFYLRFLEWGWAWARASSCCR